MSRDTQSERLSSGETCRELGGISKRTLGRLVESGKLNPTTDEDGVRWFDPHEVAALKRDGVAKTDDDTPDRDYVLEFALEALKEERGHTRALIKLVYEPVQKTVASLLEELTALRAENKDVREMHSELMRAMLELEVDADRARAELRLKQDAMSFAKEHLGPAILDNIGARAFIAEFSDDDLAAFRESGIKPRQQKFIDQILKTRREAAAKSAATPKEPANTNAQPQPAPTAEAS